MVILILLLIVGFKWVLFTDIIEIGIVENVPPGADSFNINLSWFFELFGYFDVWMVTLMLGNIGYDLYNKQS